MQKQQSKTQGTFWANLPGRYIRPGWPPAQPLSHIPQPGFSPRHLRRKKPLGTEQLPQAADCSLGSAPRSRAHARASLPPLPPFLPSLGTRPSPQTLRLKETAAAAARAPRPGLGLGSRCARAARSLAWSPGKPRKEQKRRPLQGAAKGGRRRETIREAAPATASATRPVLAGAAAPSDRRDGAKGPLASRAHHVQQPRTRRGAVCSGRREPGSSPEGSGRSHGERNTRLLSIEVIKPSHLELASLNNLVVFRNQAREREERQRQRDRA
ncbi:protein FAM163B isoform X2 [Dromiciops gliroides]|uniref:protein FAM163B isoform X2 n=1 Tax=Dromiciops gliroides TaxID=33562 RepID=UPI001CC380E7|nr:protein FAM163B isoform X2 [Dromiciops gliroides]